MDRFEERSHYAPTTPKNCCHHFTEFIARGYGFQKFCKMIYNVMGLEVYLFLKNSQENSLQALEFTGNLSHRCSTIVHLVLDPRIKNF